MYTSDRQVGFYKIAIILGLLSAIGPFAIDMYLPALPQISQFFTVGVAEVQFSLTVFLIAQSVSQLFYGPLSDKFGRKPPLFIGMGIFFLATLGCIFASSLDELIVYRFLQGIGAAAGVVIARAIVRDMYTGVMATKLMSLLMLVFGISPILAPLVGSTILTFTDWRGIFVLVAICAGLGLLLIQFGLRESQSLEERQHTRSQGSSVKAYLTLLKDNHYMGLVFAGSFALANFFIYLANSPFVLIEHYGLNETQYGLAFGLNAMCFFFAAQFNGRLCARYGIESVIRAGKWIGAIAMCCMSSLYLIGFDSLYLFMGCYLIASAGVGLVIPTTSILAMENHGRIAGTASALLGTMQIAIGPIFIAVLSPLMDKTPLPMVLGMTSCSLIALLFVTFTLSKKTPFAEA